MSAEPGGYLVEPGGDHEGSSHGSGFSGHETGGGYSGCRGDTLSGDPR